MAFETLTDGGVQFVPQLAAVKQLVYLDFDGELTQYRNPELDLVVSDVEVKDSGLTEERIAQIVIALNEQFGEANVEFVTKRPEQGEYSTVYIGKTSSFEPYGNFAGLAETVDTGNQIKNDNAFVILDSTDDNAKIVETIAHETSHLIGTLDHGGEGLQKYGYFTEYYVGYEETSTGITLEECDYMYVYSGGTANCTTVNSSGYMYVESGGTANCTTVNSSGYMAVSSGGTANCTTVNDGYMYVSSGGTALEVKENGGYVSVGDGTNVTFVANSFSGVVLSNWQSVTVHSGTTANNTTVNSGFMDVYSGGTANCTTVNNWSHMYVSSGGTANSTAVNSGGRIIVSSGGIVAGTLQIASGAVVSAYAGATIDFTVAEQANSGTALINDWSLISCADYAVYTITVNADQAAGTYVLTGGAAAFNRTVTVKTADNATLDTLAVGGSFEYNDQIYSLNLADGNLLFGIYSKPIVPPTPEEPVEVSGGSYTMAPKDGDGGVAAVGSDCSFTGNDVTFAENIANGNGGAFNNSGELNLDSVTFDGNAATGLGGAIYNDVGGEVNMNGLITLATETDTIENLGTLNWDLTGGTEDHALLAGFDKLNNSGTLLLTANAFATGAYTFATGVEETLDDSKKTFTLDLIQPVLLFAPKGGMMPLMAAANSAEPTLTVDGDSFFKDGHKYSITQSADTLVYKNELTYALSAVSSLVDHGGATFSVNGQPVTEESAGTVVTLNVAALDGFSYTLESNVEFTEAGENKYTFTMPEEAVNVTVNYDITETYVNSNYTASSCKGVWGVNSFNNYAAAVEAAGDKPVVVTGGSFSSTAYGFHDVTIGDGYNRVCYGGVKLSESTVPDNNPSTDLKITGGTLTGAFGGNFKDSGEYNKVECGVNLSISNGLFTSITCGDNRVDQGVLIHEGDIFLTISGGEFKRQVFGGSYLAPTATFTAITGDINVTLSGGTFAQSFYCGNAALTQYDTMRTYVDGDIDLTIDVSQNQLKFEILSPGDTSDICVGSFRYGVIHGNVSATLTGKGENLSFDRTLLGASSAAYYYRDSKTGERLMESYVTGSRTLTIDNFQGNFGGLIKMFTICNLKNDSAIAFTHANSTLADIATWNLEWGSSISGLVNNDFKGDTLNFDLTGWDESVWDVMGVTSSASGFKNFATATVSFKIGDVTEKGEWNGSEFVSDSFKAYTEDKTLKVAKLA